MIRVDMEEKDFQTLLFWAFDHQSDCEETRLLWRVLEGKLDKLVNRELYTKYKTALTDEQREAARQEYLDRKGIHPDFRWT